jgi:hypothetical protein
MRSGEFFYKGSAYKWSEMPWDVFNVTMTEGIAQGSLTETNS